MSSKRLVTVARTEVLRRIGQARSSVDLVSPFLSRDVALAITDQISISRPRTRRLLTAIDGEQVGSSYLDARALRILREAGFEIRSIPNLHAKVVFVDDGWCLVGSGNLTSSGLGAGARPNVELGVTLGSSDRDEARVLVDRWWRKAAPVSDDVIRQLEAAESAAGSRPPLGPVVGVPLRLDQDRFVRGSRDLRRPASSGRNHWVKAMYYDADKDRRDWWLRATWINDVHWLSRSGEPRRRPGYAVGDFIVLYLKQPRVCPAIFEVTQEPRFLPKFVARNAPGNESRWSWVTRVRVVAATTIAQAPGLGVTGKTGRSLQNGFVRLPAKDFQKARRRITRARPNS